MIKDETGDLFAAKADALVNPVNCVGRMGKGLALAFKDRYRGNYQAYAYACSLGRVKPGRMFVYDLWPDQLPQMIINFPTKRHWRQDSRLDDIEAGMADLVRVAKRHGLRTIAMPRLGCGLGGLSWEDVKPLIGKAFHGTPETTVLVVTPEKNIRRDSAVAAAQYSPKDRRCI